MGDHVGILSVVLFLPALFSFIFFHLFLKINILVPFFESQQFLTALFSFIFFPLIFKNQHPGSFGVEVRVDRAIASSIVLYLAS